MSYSEKVHLRFRDFDKGVADWRFGSTNKEKAFLIVMIEFSEFWVELENPVLSGINALGDYLCFAYTLILFILF